MDLSHSTLNEWQWSNDFNPLFSNTLKNTALVQLLLSTITLQFLYPICDKEVLIRELSQRCIPNAVGCNVFRKDVNKLHNHTDISRGIRIPSLETSIIFIIIGVTSEKIRILDSTISSPNASSSWSSVRSPSKSSSTSESMYGWYVNSSKSDLISG